MSLRLSFAFSKPLKTLVNVGLVAGTVAAFAGTAGSASAQETATSREVVQPLATPAVEQLNRALRRLARSPRNLDALINAGNAAMELGDLDAAIGFFGRAQELSPQNSRVKLGMAAVFLKSDRPIEALQAFNEAEAAGAVPRDVMSDRGLAYDLVGNNVQAQRNYREALTLERNDETLRRLALSLAIAGDREGFESTLLPMLQARDSAAFRTRAFGLAILGDYIEAGTIARAAMPRDLAARMVPYLEFMPRLTKAQQAAAANLGVFPAAADVGRDDPRFAQFAEEGRAITSNASGRLTPSGRPLGAQAPTETAEPETLLAEERVSAAPVQASRQNVADAFGAFDEDPPPIAASTSNTGAVDIASIEVPREAAASEETERATPAHPARQWVQVATGRDRSALRFDWRRISRGAPDLLGDFSPHVVAWGQSNRLLAGPVKDAAEARVLVNALREKGIDTFAYASPEGQDIQALN